MREVRGGLHFCSMLSHIPCGWSLSGSVLNVTLPSDIMAANVSDTHLDVDILWRVTLPGGMGFPNASTSMPSTNMTDVQAALQTELASIALPDDGASCTLSIECWVVDLQINLTHPTTVAASPPSPSPGSAAALAPAPWTDSSGTCDNATLASLKAALATSCNGEQLNISVECIGEPSTGEGDGNEGNAGGRVQPLGGVGTQHTTHGTPRWPHARAHTTLVHLPT